MSKLRRQLSANTSNVVEPKKLSDIKEKTGNIYESIAIIAKRANQIRVAAAAGTWGERGARINSISPGVISTAMGRLELDSESGALMRAMVENSGLRRLGTPEDIAAATEFVLGPSASFVTGTDLLVDGGVVAAITTGTIDLAKALAER